MSLVSQISSFVSICDVQTQKMKYTRPLSECVCVCVCEQQRENAVTLLCAADEMRRGTESTAATL